MIKSNLRNFPSAQKRREFLEQELDIKLDKISGFNFPEEQVLGRNIENLIGSTQLPLGVAGPLLIRPGGVKAHLRGVLRYIPLATTEGALVASVSRGCKAIAESGGAEVFVEEVGITRGPVFKVKNLKGGLETKKWIDDHFPDIAKITEQTSNHLTLKKIGCRLVGRNLFARFYYDCQEAMGMNMVTIATQQAIELIEKQTKAKCISVAGNFDIDKNSAWLNFISGRGKRVWAEVILPKSAVKEVLKTTPQKLAEIVYRKCLLGSIMSGSLGFNAHFANIVAAIFAATGQDLAHTVEGSLGITTAEVLDNGNLHFSVYLPSLVAGTIGGGTSLPTQQEALKLMKVNGVLEYAAVTSTAVLAGELSLLASEAEGSLAKAHQQLGRNQKLKVKSKEVF
ncbi:hydroxymethylglutaryl-CoA reductase [Candidatus Daviesbacteria bacterium]|nr:hydroxymethylglutaryl-CoA reductase [Candidatus Daviesbacteria bacterium]